MRDYIQRSYSYLFARLSCDRGIALLSFASSYTPLTSNHTPILAAPLQSPLFQEVIVVLKNQALPFLQPLQPAQLK
jgi:hypothetical protein